MKEAKTFGELYTALSTMKTNLESKDTIDSIDITMDVNSWYVADIPTDDTSEVMVKLDIVEKVGPEPYVVSNTTPDHNDFYIVYF